jgi:hypothetical protein
VVTLEGLEHKSNHVHFDDLQLIPLPAEAYRQSKLANAVFGLGWIAACARPARPPSACSHIRATRTRTSRAPARRGS